MQTHVIRAQLDRIAASRAFVRAGRMFPLLEYLVAAELEGRSRSLSQREIAIRVFGRDEHFDPTCDAIVRVEIGRLRNKLREYYATDGSREDIVVDVPKGCYRATIAARLQADTDSAETLPPPEIRHCRTPDGIELAFAAAGDGYPLVALPHWMSHLEDDLGNPLHRHYWAALGSRYRLIRYDTRGFGLSQRDVPDFGFDALVTDLETVVDALGLERFALLGPSGGGPVGAAFAARHPGRVSHLILLGSYIRGGRRHPDPDVVRMTAALESTIEVGWGLPDSRFRRIFSSMMIPGANARQVRWIDDAQLAAATAESAVRYYRLHSEIDLSGEVAAIEARTLVLHGSGEMGIPLAEAEYAAGRIPGARLVLLPTRNHVLLPDEPAWPEFLNQLDGFLPGRPRESAAGNGA